MINKAIFIVGKVVKILKSEINKYRYLNKAKVY